MAAFSEEFGKILSEAIGDRANTVIARMTGKSHTAISWWRNGQVPSKIEDIRLLADKLGISRVKLISSTHVHEPTIRDIEWDKKHGKDSENEQANVIDIEATDDHEDPMLEILSPFGSVIRRPRRPHLGTVPAGLPEEREAVFRAAREGPFDYDLTVKGDSLIEIDIYEGDLVIVQPDRLPKVGDIVVATVNGENVLKVLAARRENGEVVYSLKPANGKYQEIKEGDIVIQGVVSNVEIPANELTRMRKEVRMLKDLLGQRVEGQTEA